MRPVDIRLKNVHKNGSVFSARFRKNMKFYWQEALGLAIFMVSACFFSGILFGESGYFLKSMPDFTKHVLLGLLMGLTALFIFYSPFTSPSGSHINPAVTLTFFRLRKIGFWDTLFYILFQFAGGTLTVYLMAAWMGGNLSNAPLHDVVTIPGKYGIAAAAFTEWLIAFIMMSMILFVADNPVLKTYSRVFAAILVSIFVICAGPVSGFGMNPARSFASAMPANIWDAFWIYLFMPLAGMLVAAEFYLFVRRIRPVTRKTASSPDNKQGY
jgi:aquaporin Z